MLAVNALFGVILLYFSSLIGYVGGIPSSSTLRIVGGIKAKSHQFPFVVSLRNKNGEHFCAGSLLNEQWILTSAHCSHGFEFSEFAEVQIVAGDHSVMSPDDSEQTRHLMRIINHPEFSLEFQPPPNDIAMWQTSQDFDLNPVTVHAVTLDSPHLLKNGFATAIGWGRFYKDGNLPEFLRKVVVPIMIWERCAQVWEDVNQFITDRMLCAGGDNRGTCSGDSGGPLMCHIKTLHGLKMVQCGIVSSGYPCAVGYPDVYTRVEYFLDFINQTISLHSRPKSNPISCTGENRKKHFFSFW